MSKPTGNVVVVVVVRVCVRERVVLNVPESSLSPSLSCSTVGISRAIDADDVVAEVVVGPEPKRLALAQKA
jgi:hypothetical protein